MVEILQLVHEISSFPEVLYKKGVLKNFSRFADKHKKQHTEVFCHKMFLKTLQNSEKNVFSGDAFLIRLQAGNMKLSEAVTGDVL